MVNVHVRDPQGTVIWAHKPVKTLKTLLRGMVRKSFPGLKTTTINVSFMAESDLVHPMASALFSRDRALLALNPHFLKLPRQAKIGLLAHELVHLEEYSQRNYIWNLVWLLTDLFKHEVLAKLFPRLRGTFERAHKSTDVRAIEKGYGRELAAYRRFLKHRLSPSALRKLLMSYLSESEIRQRLKQRGRSREDHVF